MDRLDLYTAVHKMQRSRLFDLTVEAGMMDPDDAGASSRIAAAVDALCAELAAHADHEDRFIHPLLYEYAPSVAAELDAQHRDIDERLDALRRIASARVQDPNLLYRALANFTAVYLRHLAHEEGEALRALWDHCDDAELFDVLSAFKGSRSDIENLTSVLAQLPTLNPPEIQRMVSAGFGSTGTAQIADILATILDPGQLGALHGSGVLDT